MPAPVMSDQSHSTTTSSTSWSCLPQEIRLQITSILVKNTFIPRRMPRPDHYQIPRTKSEYLELSEVDQQRAKRDYKVWKLQGFALIQVSRGLTADCIRPLGELRARLEEEEAKLREPDPSTRFHAGRLAAVRSKLYSLEKSQKLLSQVLSALEMKAGNE